VFKHIRFTYSDSFTTKFVGIQFQYTPRMKTLARVIASLIDISDEEANVFMSFCYRKSFKKKSLISNEDKYIDEVYFIEKGILRVKITDLQGKEHTTHFAIENQFIADYNAFLTGEKSSYQLEALEDTEVIVMPRNAIEWGYQNMTEGQKLGRLIAEHYFVYLDTRIQRLYTLSPIEHYNLMSQIFPNIHNRVPQHMVASYLGITPIHLSRIKNNVRKT